MKIKFCVASQTGDELRYISKAIESGQLAGDGFFTKSCTKWFENFLGAPKCLLTPSCTHALEMTAILLDIQPGDEIIMPSYTFVSTANAFVLRGAKIVFVDIRPDNMNIDETKIEAAVTHKTKAIVPVHYAGVACDMDAIMDIAKRNNLFVVEDAAQGLMSYYKGKPLGTIGHFGTISFHTTKNFTSGGEGGLLIVNDDNYSHRAEIFREKGTDRAAFFRGDVDKYTWRDIGSSMLPSEVQAAYLWAQLCNIDKLHNARMNIWNEYKSAFSHTNIQHSGGLSKIEGSHNGHIFYLIGEKNNRTYLPKFRELGIQATSHYEPLHSSQMGYKHGQTSANMTNTDYLSSHLIRLPIFASMTSQQAQYVISAAKDILT